MQTYASLIGLWVFALGAMFMGIYRSGTDLGTIDIGLGAMGVLAANVLMILQRRISELERRVEAASTEPS